MRVCGVGRAPTRQRSHSLDQELEHAAEADLVEPRVPRPDLLAPRAAVTALIRGRPHGRAGEAAAGGL